MSDTYQNRQYTIRLIFVVAMLLLLLKALHLQLFDRTYKSRADATAIDKYTQYPSRGLIFDRNKKLLVNNNPVYDLLVTYNQVDPEMNVQKFCNLLGIDTLSFRRKLEKDWNNHRFSKSTPFVFQTKISAETFASFQESLYEFPGFFVQVRNVRGYPHQNASHILGFIREVNQNEIDTSVGVYQLGDYIGASGIEKEYDSILRGKKGVRYVLKDNIGREVGPYKNAQLDTIPISGKNLISTIDLELQQYAEQFMHNKTGSIIAIEPGTGEILAMLSSPFYDPNELALNRNRGEAFRRLEENPSHPFFDRTVMARYPPGSLFKPIMALIAMQEEVLFPDRTIYCEGAYYYNGIPYTGCHLHPTAYNVEGAIQYSCNTYFVQVFRETVEKYGFHNAARGLDSLASHLSDFGLGMPLGIDYPREKRGNIPGSGYYDNLYGNNRWYSTFIMSLGIGQGEIELTSLQMANLVSILANRGHYYSPHLVKGFIDEETKDTNYVNPARN